jgi:hypothetical protein
MQPGILAGIGESGVSTGERPVRFVERETEGKPKTHIHRRDAETQRKTKISSPQRHRGHRERPNQGDVKAVSAASSLGF